MSVGQIGGAVGGFVGLMAGYAEARAEKMAQWEEARRAYAGPETDHRYQDRRRIWDAAASESIKE